MVVRTGVRLPASDDGSPAAVGPIDAGYESAGHLDDTAPLIEAGDYAPPIGDRRWCCHSEPQRNTIPSQPRPGPRRRPPSGLPLAAARTTSARGRPARDRQRSGYKRVITGLASWYDNGTTAMRLPHGTRIRICGVKSCITTVVRDWGPARYLSNRVVDMTPCDFVRVTGKSLGAGLAPVKVYIY